VIVAALAVAALATAPVPLLDAPKADSVAVAGDAVLVARHAARGRVLVDALPVAGGAPRRLLDAAGPAKGWGATADVSASSQRVAVRVFASRLGNEAEEQFRWSFYTGPVAGPLRLEYTSRGKGFIPFEAAVDGDRVLLAEGRLASFATRLRVFDPGVPPRVLPWGGLVSPPIALAGSHVAYAGSTQHGGDAIINRVFVADLETGAHQVSITDRQAIGADVTADGRVVADRDDGLIAAAPGVRRTVLPGSRGLYQPRFAGTSVAALQRSRFGAVRPVALDAGATRPRALGVPSFEIADLDADERGVTWIGNGCVLYAPVGAPAPAEPPAGPCPRAEVALERVDTKLHGRTVRLRLACVAAAAGGCRGTTILRRRGAAIGRTTFRIPAGSARPVAVVLGRRAAQAIRRAIEGPKGFALLGLDLAVRDGRASEPRAHIVIDQL
jgi:hypothetical protein